MTTDTGVAELAKSDHNSRWTRDRRTDHVRRRGTSSIGLSLMPAWWPIIALGTVGLAVWYGRALRRRSTIEPTHPATTPAEAVAPWLSAREPIEDRITAQLAELDRLIDAADDEIARLEAALAVSRGSQPTVRALTRDEQQRCFAMWEAGFSVEEIADCLVVTPTSVQSALDEWRRPEQRAA